MHHRMHWALATLAALVISLSPGSVLAGPPPLSPSDVPVVVRAVVDQLEPDRLVIRGMNFGVTSAPVVLLAKVPLEVLSFSDEEIIARLPLDAPPARYRLQVFAHGWSSSPFFEVTLGRRPGRRAEGEYRRVQVVLASYSWSPTAGGRNGRSRGRRTSRALRPDNRRISCDETCAGFVS